MSSNSGWIGSVTSELRALECRLFFSILIMESPKISWPVLIKFCMPAPGAKLNSKFREKWLLPPAGTGEVTTRKVGWLCWGLTSQSTIFQSCQDGAIASWVINQYFRWVKCLAQGHNTAAVGLEPLTSRSGVRHSTTEPPCSPTRKGEVVVCNYDIFSFNFKEK